MCTLNSKDYIMCTHNIYMNPRTQRAKQIMATSGYCSQIDHDKFKVRSQTDPTKFYIVSKDDKLVCECKDHTTRKADCKHIKIVLDVMRRNGGSTGQSNPPTPTKNTPKRRLASQSGIADGFGLSKKGSILRKICIVPLYGWVFLTRIRSGYQVALEPVVHLAPQNHCYCPL